MLGYATEEIALRYVMCHHVSSWLIVFCFLALERLLVVF